MDASLIFRRSRIAREKSGERPGPSENQAKWMPARRNQVSELSYLATKFTSELVAMVFCNNRVATVFFVIKAPLCTLQTFPSSKRTGPSVARFCVEAHF